MYDKMNGIGAHEVIIETADHTQELPDYSQTQMELVLRAYRDRINDLKNDARFKYMLVFKNHGARPGATLEHSHSQLIAVPVTPKRGSEELFYCRDYYEYKERCLLCDIISQEQLLEERLVLVEENMIAMMPYASRFPFEVHILPRRHLHDYGKITDKEIASLAYVLKTVLKKIRQVLGDPAYNYILHTSPVTLPRPGRPELWGTIEQDFHWHIEIIPRLTRIAGFEWGTGFYINPVTPENAARFLRDETVDA
jgi:UDPglucose--hexose-1-phosphate uridylyltransferase